MPSSPIAPATGRFYEKMDQIRPRQLTFIIVLLSALVLLEYIFTKMELAQEIKKVLSDS